MRIGAVVAGGKHDRDTGGIERVVEAADIRIAASGWATAPGIVNYVGAVINRRGVAVGVERPLEHAGDPRDRGAGLAIAAQGDAPHPLGTESYADGILSPSIDAQYRTSDVGAVIATI